MLQNSPLTFKFISEPLESIRSTSAPGISPVAVAAPIDLHFVESESETTTREQTDPSTTESDPIKTFTLWVQPSQGRYNHKSNIRRNPTHGRWPEVKPADHDFAYYALKEVIPDNIALHGLCDWVTGGQLSEDVKLARTDQESGENWQIRDRIERRRNSKLLSADDHELTSWTSIKSGLQSRDDAIGEASQSVKKPTDELVDDGPADDESGSETISEPLRMDSPQSQALDSQLDPSEAADSSSDQAPEFDHQNDDGGSMTTSTSKQILQKILEMPISSKAPPAQEADSESLCSQSSDQSNKNQTPRDHASGT